MSARPARGKRDRCTPCPRIGWTHAVLRFEFRRGVVGRQLWGRSESANVISSGRAEARAGTHTIELIDPDGGSFPRYDLRRQPYLERHSSDLAGYERIR